MDHPPCLTGEGEPPTHTQVNGGSSHATEDATDATDLRNQLGPRTWSCRPWLWQLWITANPVEGDAFGGCAIRPYGSNGASRSASSLATAFTRVEIGHMAMRSAAYFTSKSRGSGST